MLWDLLKALKIGEELKNPAAWKKGQLLLTGVGTLVAMGLKHFAPDLAVDQEFANAVSDGIIYTLVAVNLYITKASSKKV